MKSNLNDLFAIADTEFDSSLDKLFELIRFPSIGVDQSYDQDTRACANWLVDHLKALGCEAELCETPGQPVVLAKFHDVPEGAPHIMYYGHYDVQPPGPSALWETTPFGPEILPSEHGKKVVGRGAVDDKGQFLTFLEAIRIWKENRGQLPARITIVIEGEEENSSMNFPSFLKENREVLDAEICIISDTLIMDVNSPAITISMRGNVYCEVEIKGAGHDLHSGTFGGNSVNPIHELSRIISELHDSAGRVQIEGFYDNIIEPPSEVLRGWATFGFDEAEFAQAAELSKLRGEEGRSPVERMWSRPCIDVNGIWGGYTGPGRMTVIPSVASAKLCCRSVFGQEPEDMAENLKTFFETRLPDDCTMSFKILGKTNAVRVAHDSKFISAAQRATEKVYGKPALLRGGSGSLPLIDDFQKILGIDCLLMGFGLADDRVHSPNEKFELTCMRNGLHSHLALLDEIEKMFESS